MRNLPLVVMILGLAGCAGTDPSASGVFPSAGFLGRSMRVEISGDATEWGASSKVSFGEGVTVDSITVASPTALFADITIADTAPVGLRDIVVTGGDNATLKQAFEIESPITITLRGSLAQGSIATLDVVNHDFDTPFDTTSVSPGLFQPPVFTNIAATAGNGVRVEIDDVTPYGISATLLIDIDAQTGPLAFTSGPTGDTTVKFPLGADMAIAARTAMPLTAGTNATATSTKPVDSFLYEFTPATFPSLARFQVTTTGDGSPGIAVLPASGHFEDLLGVTADQRQVAKTSGKFYAVLYDLSGEAGAYTIRAGSAPLTVAADTEPTNNTQGAATACALPCLVENATLASITDQDWFVFTAVAGDVGKKVHVRTQPGDDLTDTFVDVIAGSTSLGGPSDDGDYHEDFVTTAITAAGLISTKIYASPVFKPAYTHYDALIYLE
jgi:hypothetical protein